MPFFFFRPRKVMLKSNHNLCFESVVEKFKKVGNKDRNIKRLLSLQSLYCVFDHNDRHEAREHSENREKLITLKPRKFKKIIERKPPSTGK